VRPFQADSDFALMLAHVKQSPRPPIELQPGLPPGLNDIILKAIAKNPADRFASADEFRQALRTLPASGLGQSASGTATVLASASAPTMAAAATLPAPPPSAERASGQSSTDHPRTLIDTRTPSAPRVPTPAGAPPNLVVQALPRKTVHPGLYMALGGVLVIATLIGTGVYMRRAEAGTDSSSKTENASGGSPTPAKSAAAPTPAASPAREATPIPQPPAPTPAEALPATASATRPPAPSGASHANAKLKPATRPANVVRPAATGGTAADTPAAQASPKDAAELDQLEQEIDGLAARATAVNNSLDHLQQEQARQGLGLRGDMAARQQSMKSNLAKAQDALEKGDAARARRFSDQAQKDIDALEQFLGR
jgi:serine/threonine-protein kinase